MLRNIGSNWMLKVLQVASMWILVPFVIDKLGQDGDGVWKLIVAFTGYLSLLILGVPMASVRHISEAVGREDNEETNRVVGTCIGLYLGLGAAAFLAGLGLFGFFTTYDIDPAWEPGARVAFLMVILHISLGFVQQLPYAILAAHHDFVTRNLIIGSSLLLKLGLTIVLLSWRAELVMVAAVLLAQLAFEFVIAIVVVKRRYPHIRFRVSGFDRRTLKQILGFSMFAMVINVGIKLSFQTDALVIGKFLNEASISIYDVANSFDVYLMEFMIGIAAVIMPMATRLRTQGKETELRDMFLRWSKIALSLSLVAGLYLMVFGPEFLGAWVKKPGYAEQGGPVLRAITLSFFLFLPVRAVAMPIVMGVGSPAKPAIAFLVTGLLNLGISLALVGKYGIWGVALGTAIPNVLFAAVVLHYACRDTGVSIGSYLAYVFPRAALGCIPVLGYLLAIKLSVAPQRMLALLATGVGSVIVFAIVWVFFVYRGDRYGDLSAKLKARLGRA